MSYYSRLFILFISMATYTIKRNRRDQKDCCHWEKKGQGNWNDCNKIHSKTLKRSVRESFLMKIQTNSHTSQVGTVVFRQKFSKRKMGSARLVFNQIPHNFYFHKVYSQNSLKTFTQKIKRLKYRLRKCKKHSVMCNQNFSWKKKNSRWQFCYLILTKTFVEKSKSCDWACVSSS